MKPRDPAFAESLKQIRELLDRWKDLTLDEEQAILSSNWTGLSRFQASKRDLQSQIEQTELRLLGPGQTNGRSAEKLALRQITAELLSMEERNRVLLADKIAEA